MSYAKRLIADKKRKPRGTTFVNVTSEIFDNKQINELFAVLKMTQQNRALQIVFQEATRGLKQNAKTNRATTRKNPTKTRNKLIKSLAVEKLKKYVGVRIGFRVKSPWSGSIAHLIDQGTKVRNSSKGNRGKVSPSHFWTSARESEAPHLHEKVKAAIQSGFDKYAQQYNKKYSK